MNNGVNHHMAHRGVHPGAGPVLITGGAGFIGSNLADRLATDGHDVIVFDLLARPGVAANLEWLKQRHPQRVTAIVADIRDRAAVHKAAQGVSAVFHLAAQVAVTSSFQDPDHDFEVNLRGTLNVIDALRRHPEPPPLIFASTNKVYGDLADVALHNNGTCYRPVDADLRAFGISEDRPLAFHTPYGCSKGAADQYVLDAARSFGVPAVVFRMSCIYGPRQMGTEDQGWLAHFMLAVLRNQPVVLYGDGQQMRDVLFVDDCVDAYVAAWENIGRARGCAFNFGGGVGNAVTLLQALREIESLTGRRADLHFTDWRQGDQRYFVADSRRISATLGLQPPMFWREGLVHLADWMQSRQHDDADIVTNTDTNTNISTGGEDSPAAPDAQKADAKPKPRRSGRNSRRDLVGA